MAAKKQECMIIGAAPIESEAVFQEFPPEKYYVICADAGYETAVKYGITPDLIVGDFDSAKTLPPKSRKVLSLPVEKDVTDTMYAAVSYTHLMVRMRLSQTSRISSSFSNSVDLMRTKAMHLRR